MAIAPGQVSADPADSAHGERVIVPTSIYAPGTLVDAPPDGDGAPAGAPPHPGQAPGPGAGEHAQPGEHPYGDYAYVIREEEQPGPRSRPAGPGRQSTASQPPSQEPPSPEPASAWGPDDPAYGPPSPGWYTEDQAEQQAAEELQPVRGVFEPHPNQGDFGVADPADDRPPLEKIRHFYLTAEAISAENLDTQFDELLERQRQLISAYFTEAALQEDPR